MATLRKGDDVRVANSNYVINSLKRQGYEVVKEGAKPAVPEAPTIDKKPEAKKTRKGGKE